MRRQGYLTLAVWVCPDAGQAVISENAVHHITAWYPDESDAEVFCVIVKSNVSYASLSDAVLTTVGFYSFKVSLHCSEDSIGMLPSSGRSPHASVDKPCARCPPRHDVISIWSCESLE